MAAPHIVARWNALTREMMPRVARERGWPVRLDHCFQRILLDNAVGAAWRTRIAAPAWRHANDHELAKAIALGDAAMAGRLDLEMLDRRSLAWRGKFDPAFQQKG